MWQQRVALLCRRGVPNRLLSVEGCEGYGCIGHVSHNVPEGGRGYLHFLVCEGRCCTVGRKRLVDSGRRRAGHTTDRRSILNPENTFLRHVLPKISHSPEARLPETEPTAFNRPVYRHAANTHVPYTCLRPTTVEIGILRRVGPRHLPTRRTSPTRRAPTPCTTLYDASYIPDASGPDALYDTVRRVVQCLKQHSAPPPLLSNTLPPPPSLKQHSAPPLLLSNTLHRGRAVWGL